MGLSSYGQDRTIDSLKLALKNAKHDTTRCNVLSSLTKTASDEEWPVFNEQLKVLAEKNVSGKAEPRIFYLKHLAVAINNSGAISYNQGDIPKALEYFSKGLKIREEIGDKKGTANSLNNLGAVCYDKGDIPKAIEYYNKSLKIQEEIGNKQGTALSLNNIGIIYKDQGDIPRALEYYSKSLKIYEEIGNKEGTANSLNSIGVIYNEQGDILKALEYFNKGLKIREEVGDKQGTAQSLNNIGTIYYEQGDPSVTSSKENARRAGFPKALDYYNKSLKIREEIGDKYGAASSLNNIGAVYQDQGDILKALECFSNSLKIREEIGDKKGTSSSLNNVANLNLKKGEVKEALVFANRGMQLAKELGFPENIKKSAGTLKQIFQKQNKYKEAFEMFELEIKMKDSINNEETQKAAVKKQMQYEYEAKAKELQNEQEKKDLLAKTELIQREKERNYFIFGFALVIVLAGFIFRSYRQKQKANILITHQKKEVEESRKEILDSIHYAKRIQRAMIPSDKFIETNLRRLQKKE